MGRAIYIDFFMPRIPSASEQAEGQTLWAVMMIIIGNPAAALFAIVYAAAAVYVDRCNESRI